MSISHQETLQGCRMTLEFIEGLDETTFKRWLAGEYILTLQPSLSAKKVKKENKKEIIWQEMYKSYEQKLKIMDSYEEAIEYLQSLKFNKQQLKDLGSAWSIYIQSRDTKEKIIYKIVEEVVGNKLKIQVLGNKGK
ncbi:hypothetical protein PBV87_05115 [Niameybacter massiliensis]|uniref:Uncharacterized protein n=1 Tax=Holtiella tumoricola TaxID=3018743 RepID=A0AA42J026_9FIRM|nr:hypothetical protein [Holtiella tumoricola]MDA3730879.1 hypothetical protein [Holtiella tumoricola]